MKILLTGCAGFIGWKTADLLLQQGHTVTGVDNMNDYYDVRLKDWRLAQLKSNDSFTFVEGDIESFEFVSQLFQGDKLDAVINLAARAGVRASMEDPFIYNRTNSMGTLNILESMKASGTKKLVMASTSSLYAGQEMPFTETLAVNEPISPYAATKKAAEVMAYTYHHLYNIDVSVVRYFTVYGPAGRPDMSPLRFTYWIDNDIPITLFGDGSQSRDFTFVDDIASGTIAALKPVGYEIFNLGGGNNPISINTMIEGLENRLGKKGEIDNKPFNSSDMMHTWADISKAKTILNWEPTIGFEDGMDQLVAWYRDNQELACSLNY